MPLLDKDGWKAEDYRRDEAGAPAVIVPLDALEAALAARAEGQRIGVDMPNDAVPSELKPIQDKVDLIAVAFPVFKDGRGFSVGRMLREQGFKGTLRATGSVTPDQFHFLLRCGYDEVELSEEQAARQPVEQWLRVPTLFSVHYQQDGDGVASIFEQRKAATR